MQLHFQERPWDLYLVASYTVAVASTLFVLRIGNLLAILLVLFLPGYALVATLFPGEDQIDWIERLILSSGLSIAVVPLLGLILNFTPFGLHSSAVITTVALFTVLLAGAAWWRRMQLPIKDRLSATLYIVIPVWKDYTRTDKILVVALAASISAAAGSVSYVVVVPRPMETFTEFYILGPGGNASGYPTALNVSQPGTVILGIANHEAVSVSYAVRIDLVGVQLVYNATSGFNETIEVNRTTWSILNVTLSDNANWTYAYGFDIQSPGLWKVQFLLFKSEDFSAPYRELHLFVRVV